MSEQYNGWSNRETWLIQIWFNPESKSDVQAAKEQFEASYEELPDFMKDFVYDDSINWNELEAQFDEEEQQP